MLNGNVNEFIEGLYRGYEMTFIFRGQKYFIQGYLDNNARTLFLVRIEPPVDNYIWKQAGDRHNYPVEAFLQAPIFGGKTFFEVEQEIEWVDC